MSRSRVARRRGGKFFTGFFAFLLGFIFAIVAEFATIAALTYYILYSPIDDLFNMAQVDNDDGNGNQFIDTTGDIKTVMNLIDEIRRIAGVGWNDMRLGDVIELSPALEAKLQELYDMAEKYGVHIDGDALLDVKGGELSDFIFNDVIREIRPYEVLVKNTAENPELAENPHIITILDGREAATVAIGGNACVVYYDEYIEGADGLYYRISNNTTTSSSLPYTGEQLDKWFVRTNSVWKEELNDAGIDIAENSFIYQMYYCYAEAEDKYYVVTRTAATDTEGNQSFVYENTGVEYVYGGDIQRYTGNYTLNANGEREYLTYTYTDEDGNSEERSLEITVGYMLDTKFITNTLYYIELPQVLAEVMGEDPILDSLFAGITLGEMFSRGIEFSNQVDQFALADVLKPSANDESIILYLCYKIRNVDANALTATYIKEDGTQGNATINVSNNQITSVVDAQTGEELPKTRVSEINSLIADFDISILTGPVSVEGNVIMPYMIYGITNLQANADGTYSATYHYEDESGAECTAQATVEVNSAKEIVRVYTTDPDGTQHLINGATQSELVDRIDGVMDVMTLADFVSVTPSYVGADGNVVNANIMLFTVYSATMQAGGAQSDGDGTYYTGTYYDSANNAYPAKIYVADGGVAASEQVVSRVEYTADGTTYVSGQKTAINGVQAQINRLTSVLTIGDIITIDSSDRLMSKLGGYTINNISSAMDTIVLSDAMDIVADDPDNDIMLYVAFGVTDLYQSNGEYYATYHSLDGNSSVPAKLITTQNDSGRAIFVGITAADGSAITEGAQPFNGTLVADVGTRVGNLKNDLSLTSVLSVEVNSPIMMYLGYGVRGVEANAGGGYTGTLADGTQCTITADENGYVTGVYNTATGAEISGTKIGEIGGMVGNVTSVLTVGELITIDQNDKILSLVADCTIDELSTTIASLTIQDMYSTEIYNQYYMVVASNPGSGEVVYNAVYTYYEYDQASSSYVLANAGTANEGGLTADQIAAIGTDGATLYYAHFESEWLQVVADSSAVDAADKIAFNSEYLYYTYTDGSYTLVGGDGILTLSDLASGQTYYTRGRASGVWYLLLYDGGAEKSYTVNGLGDMMTVASNNMNTATLNDFWKAGVIEEPSHSYVPIAQATEEDAATNPAVQQLQFTTTVNVPGVGDTPVVVSYGYYEFKEIAECTIDEVMNAVTILTGLFGT